MINGMTNKMLSAQAADEAVLNSITTRIAPKLGVSAEVIAKRLSAEKLWRPTT